MGAHPIRAQHKLRNNLINCIITLVFSLQIITLEEYLSQRVADPLYCLFKKWYPYHIISYYIYKVDNYFLDI